MYSVPSYSPYYTNAQVHPHMIGHQNVSAAGVPFNQASFDHGHAGHSVNVPRDWAGEHAPIHAEEFRNTPLPSLGMPDMSKKRRSIPQPPMNEGLAPPSHPQHPHAVFAYPQRYSPSPVATSASPSPQFWAPQVPVSGASSPNHQGGVYVYPYPVPVEMGMYYPPQYPAQYAPVAYSHPQASMSPVPQAYGMPGHPGMPNVGYGYMSSGTAGSVGTSVAGSHAPSETEDEGEQSSKRTNKIKKHKANITVKIPSEIAAKNASQSKRKEIMLLNISAQSTIRGIKKNLPFRVRNVSLPMNETSEEFKQFTEAKEQGGPAFIGRVPNRRFCFLDVKVKDYTKLLQWLQTSDAREVFGAKLEIRTIESQRDKAQYILEATEAGL